MTFMVTSELYMILTCLMLKYSIKSTAIDKFDRYSIRMKTRLLILNVLSFTIAGYFFIRHNEYCEPGSELLILELK